MWKLAASPKQESDTPAASVMRIYKEDPEENLFQHHGQDLSTLLSRSNDLVTNEQGLKTTKTKPTTQGQSNCHGENIVIHMGRSI